MRPLQMLCLLLSSVLLLAACKPLHALMQPTTGAIADILPYKPAFGTALYKTQVDVVGNHLSGLLIVKKMPDSSLRMVFSNEVGFKFFDFEFDKNGLFKVYSVIQQMNKKAVLTTLRKDFELVLMQHFKSETLKVYSIKGLLYYVFPQSKGFNYYITDSITHQLVRMERASNKKTVVAATMHQYTNGIPDTIGISHKGFQFTIALKRIER